MKNYLLALVLFSISILGYSQSSSTTEGVKTVTKEIVNDALQKEPNATAVYLTEKLQQFVESLKVPAEKVFQTLVKKQTISAYTWIVLNSFFLIIVIGLWIALIKDKKGQDDWWGVPVVVTILFFISIYFTLSIITNGLFNPEYGAIKEIMELF